jgi:DNA (cytosine-5)-methyltransferase 1
MRILDLFCGAGGAAVGYHRAGFEVVGVDIKPQPRYPFEFIQGDALEFVQNCEPTRFWFRQHLSPPNSQTGQFAAIHASPPCQRWSSKTKTPENHPDLITPLRPLLEQTGLPYVIENVMRAPLRDPVFTLCGSMFGLGVRRHRLFETNFPLLVPPCDHGSQPKRYRLYDHGKHYTSPVVHVFGTGGGKGREHWQEAMGIDWTNDTDELREAIPPAYTELIGAQLMAQLRVAA